MGMDHERIFTIASEADFLDAALATFHYQYRHNEVYKDYCNYLNIAPNDITQLYQIPFLPIQFFKSKKVVSGSFQPQAIFTSSGTTGTTTSSHYVKNTGLYELSFTNGFEHFYGPVQEYCVLALLPSYLERQGSSLIYMVQDFIQRSKYPQSGFFLRDHEKLVAQLAHLEKLKTKTLLIGVSFALLDLVEQHPMQLKHCTVMETGGMKGRRKEMIREELHDRLKIGFGIANVHSEYGMTELLSQAYSKGNGIFQGPPWMKVLIRDTEDPMSLQPLGKTGGLNVIDLANIDSCSFIATQDLGKVHHNGSFEVLGRFDHADVRGCNLMAI
jgi:phenylacetate-coenzyme A ligase PaaK-like adenylate-forming protein